MRNNQRSPKPRSAQAGCFAMLRALPRYRGTAAPAGTLLAAVLALAALLVLLPATASADIGGPGAGAGGLEQPNGLAVSAKEGGDLYVADSGNTRIDQFEPDGTFVRAFGWDVDAASPEEKPQTCTAITGCQAKRTSGFENELVVGSEPGQFNRPDEIAVDNDPSSGSEYGDVYVVDQRNFRVEKFSPTGEFLLMFGGGVDHTTGADLCTAEDVNVKHDTCGAGVPGTGPAHFYKEEPGTHAGGQKSWVHEGNNSIAVGPDGTVYVGDYGRIQEFEPSGTFAGEFSLPDAEPRFVSALAVDAAGDIYEISVTYAYNPVTDMEEFVNRIPGVREYGPGPGHLLIHTFDTGPEEAGSEPTHIALDESGDLFLSDKNSGEFRFRAFKPDATLYAEFTSDQAPNAHGIAVGDAAASLYAISFLPVGAGTESTAHVAVMPLPAEGPPAVTEEHVTDVEPTTATLHAIVNPEQFDTHYRFQYIAETAYKADGNAFGAGTESTALTDLGAVSREDAVQAAISDLAAATAYRWRVVATNECKGPSPEPIICEAHPEATFETLPDVSVRDFTTQTVGPELVQLKAELDPNNGGTTRYTICYGSEAGPAEPGHDALGCTEGTLHGLGSAFEPITATFTGLQPNTTYHYQLLATNGNGEVKTTDQTLTTELSSAEERQAESCPNANLREEDDALALPDCRDYEQVSPTDKQGYPVSPVNELAPSGERDAFQSLGAFAGANASLSLSAQRYVAHRTETGWTTQAGWAYPAGPNYQPLRWEDGGFNAALDSWLFSVVPGSNSWATANYAKTITFYQGNADGSFLQATPTLSVNPIPPGLKPISLGSEWARPLAESDDLSKIFIGSMEPFLASDPRPGVATQRTWHPDRIYEVSGAGGPSPTLSLVAEVPLGLGQTEVTHDECSLDQQDGIVGLQGGIAGTFFRLDRGTSADGSVLFYTGPVKESEGAECGAGKPNPIALFACDVEAGPCAGSGSHLPLQLSAPPAAQCAPSSPCHTAAARTPTYDGASPDGRLAWFTTAQPLIDSDTDSTNDLYLAKLENGELKELVQASKGSATSAHPTPGEGAGVQGVLGLSSEGTRAAFVATGELTAEPNQLGQSAAPGADNLYLYDATSGQTKFVSRLCSGPEESGTVEDPACPAGLSPGGENGKNDAGSWLSGFENQFTPDGNYLLFSSYGRLVAGDTDGVQDVYRYDFSTGRLIRVSIGRRGNDADGNDGAYPVQVPANERFSVSSRSLDAAAGDTSRAISEDGSTVIFETAAPLVSRDTNAANDVYEWEEEGHGTCREAAGCVSLLSDGVTHQGSVAAVISSSGRDASFQTPGGLVPNDTDGIADIYDARIDGGFHATHPAEGCGAAEACRPGSAAQPAPPALASETFVGPGNGSTQLQCAKGKVRVTKHGQVRCVAKKHHKSKKHHKAKHQKKHKRANTNRRAGK